MTIPNVTEFIPHDPADAQIERVLGGAWLPVARDIRARFVADRQAATSDFVENRHITTARDTASAEREAWLTCQSANEKIRADLANQLIGERGGSELQEKAEAYRAAMVARIDTAATTALAAFRAETRASVLPPPPVEVTTENATVFERFRLGGARDFLDEAKETLRRATDPAVPNNEKLRANHALAQAYRTLVRRRAESPEAHAREYAGGYVELADLLDAHLNSLLGVERQRIADGLIASIEGERAWVRRVVTDKLKGQWDDLIIGTGAPVLYGKFRPKA